MGARTGASLIRLLIDECLSPQLTAEAYARDMAAIHVRSLGLAGAKDHALLPVILDGDYSFVTNNRSDFLRLYKKLEVHAGLLIIVPAVSIVNQHRLLACALDAIVQRGFDIVKQLCEVHTDGRVEFSSYPASLEP